MDTVEFVDLHRDLPAGERQRNRQDLNYSRVSQNYSGCDRYIAKKVIAGML